MRRARSWPQGTCRRRKGCGQTPQFPPQVFLYLLFSLAATQSWSVGAFVVADSLLFGKANSTKLYVPPPREDIKVLPQDVLIQWVKGWVGLKESPRLWWL